MKVIHWNVTRENQSITGVKRYEDELFKNLEKIIKLEANNWKIERVQRSKNKIVGSTFVSWFLKYRCKDADIVHGTEETILPVILFKKPKKFIVTCHDCTIPLLYPSTISDVTSKIQWTLIPKAIKKADRIIAVSKFTKNEIIRMFGIEEYKIDVVYEGVNHSQFYPMNKKECKKKFNLNPNEKYILIVASNDVHKRMDIVKEVFRRIREMREDVKLLKAGYAQGLEGEGIINVGWIPDEKMPMLYNAADVFFHPTEYETFGLPIVEAMACGTPVVLANVGSNPEIVGSCGKMIDLHSEDYVERFVESILKSIDKGIDKKALKRSKKFTWEKTARDTIKVYEKAIEEVE